MLFNTFLNMSVSSGFELEKYLQNNYLVTFNDFSVHEILAIFLLTFLMQVHKYLFTLRISVFIPQGNR